MRSRRLALLAFVLGCSAAPQAGLRPTAVVPSRATPDAATDVEILGQGFEPTVKTDYGGSGSAVATEFAARLAPTAGGADAPLEAVALTARSSLSARVPAGLPTGGYDLVVTAPDGRVARLRDAFQVVTAVESVVSFRFGPLAPQASGVPFWISVSAVDAAGQVVDGFTGDVTLSDATGTVAPATVGPFALGRASAVVTVAALSAADQLVATDARGRTGSSDPFAVSPGPPVALVFVVTPGAVAGACAGPYEVEVRDGLGHPATAAAPVALALDGAPPGAVAFSADAACATTTSSVALAAGATRAAFHLRAVSAGLAVVRVTPATLPSVTVEVGVAP